MQFSQVDFEQLGIILCDALLDYCDPDQIVRKTLLEDFRGKAAKREAEGKSAVASESDSDDLNAAEESDSGGSDSSSSDGASAMAEEQFRVMISVRNRYRDVIPKTRSPEPPKEMKSIVPLYVSSILSR